ncbi:hypothetical protein BOX15_Mlig007053g1 [Macrostomum lignano]|uniref:Sister chromatid cohesion protein n=3 Tax=Macrostomum lignano TaxID=282301 RepID=A0A267FZL7_9PLAT|nr:hypothetical protein BOX15_Mlig007053g1 [Macrostomum lignano]
MQLSVIVAEVKIATESLVALPDISNADNEQQTLKQALRNAWSILTELNEKLAENSEPSSNNVPPSIADWKSYSQELSNILVSFFCSNSIGSRIRSDLQLLGACCLMELFKLHCPENPFVGCLNEAQSVCQSVQLIARAAHRAATGSRGGPALGYLIRNIVGTDLPLALRPYSSELALDASAACLRCLLTAEPAVGRWDWPGGPAAGLDAAAASLNRLLDEAPELIRQSSTVGLLLDSCVAMAMTAESDNCLAVRFLRENIESFSKLIAAELETRIVRALRVDEDLDDGGGCDINEAAAEAQELFAIEQLALLLPAAHRLSTTELGVPGLNARILLPRLRSQRVADRLRACRQLSRLMLVGSSDGVARRSFVEGGWKALVARFNDVAPAVRRICLSAVPKLCTFIDTFASECDASNNTTDNSSKPSKNNNIKFDFEAFDDLRQAFKLRAVDADESVRLALVAALDALPAGFETEFRTSIMAARSRDLSSRVRIRALCSLASLSVAAGPAAGGSAIGSFIEDSQLSHVNAAASALMSAYRLHPIEVERHIADLLTVASQSLGGYSPAQSRAFVLLARWRGFLAQGAATKAAGAFLQMLKSLWHVNQLFRQTLAYLESASSDKSSNSQAWLTNRMRTLATYFPIEHHSASYVQQSLLNLHKRLAKSTKGTELHRLLASDCDLETANRLRRRISISSAINSLSSDEKALATALLTRLGPCLVDRASFVALISAAQPGSLDDLQLINALIFYRPELLNCAQPLLDLLVASLDAAPVPVNQSSARAPSRILCCLRILDTSLTSTPASAEIASSPLTESIEARLVSLCQSEESLVSKAAIGCLATLTAFSSSAQKSNSPNIAWLAEAALTADWKSGACRENPIRLLDAFGHLMKSPLAERLGLLQMDRIGNFLTNELLPLIGKGVVATGAAVQDAQKSARMDLTAWTPWEKLSDNTRLRLAAIKCLTRCLAGLRLAPEEEFADSQDAANWDAVVSQSIDALHSLLLADGQPDIAIEATPSGDLSQLRLTAAGRLIGLTRHRAYQRRLTRPDLLQALLYTAACDPCPTVRRRLLLSKLHSGLARLRLPNDFLAAYAFVTEAAGGGKDSDFQRLACASLRRVVAKRRQFMAANWDQVSQDSRLFYSLLPEACLSTAVHLWAGDPDFREPSDSRLLARPLAGMRLLLRQLLASSSNVGKASLSGGSLFTWIRRLLEKIRSSRDARSPDNDAAAGRIRAVADLTFGLLVTLSSKFVDAQLPFEPQLPKKLYCFQSGGLLKANNYPEFSSLPADFRFQQPRNRQALDSGLIPASRVAVSNPDARLLTSMAGRRRKSDGDNSIISSEEEEEDLQEPQVDKRPRQRRSCH